MLEMWAAKRGSLVALDVDSVNASASRSASSSVTNRGGGPGGAVSPSSSEPESDIKSSSSPARWGAGEDVIAITSRLGGGGVSNAPMGDGTLGRADVDWERLEGDPPCNGSGLPARDGLRDGLRDRE